MLIVQTSILEADQHKSVVVVGQDVDLLILITALVPENKDILMLKEELGNTPQKSIQFSRNSAVKHLT